MKSENYIEIKISGFKGNMEITSDNFDIKELVEVIEQTERMLFPTNRKERPLVSYHIEDGSIRNIFKTSAQTIIGFSALLGQIESKQSIDFLELNTAKAIETFQETAVKKDYTFEIRTSLPKSSKVKIDKQTYFYRTKENWVEAEFYFYGKIINVGGKEKASIRLYTNEFGILTIQTPQKFLADIENNILYKTFGIRAKGRQNTETGEFDYSSLSFIDLINYDLIYNEKYLGKLREKAKKWIKNVNPDELLKNIRGYDA